MSCSQGNAKIFYNIGKIAADRGEIEKAVENYKHSLTLYKNYTSALNNYGNILRDLGQLEKAKAILEKACSIDPQFASGLMNLAIVEMALGNYPQSEAYFKRVIQIRANHAYSHFNMANMVCLFCCKLNYCWQLYLLHLPVPRMEALSRSRANVQKSSSARWKTCAGLEQFNSSNTRP